LLNWLFARKMGGRFLASHPTIPMQPLHQGRLKRPFYRDLDWLGLSHDGNRPPDQPSFGLQHRVLQIAAATSHLSRVRTEAELERQRSLWPHASCRRSTTGPRWSLRTRRNGKGRPQAHWRFKLSRSKVSWTDLGGAGPVEIDHRPPCRSGAGARGWRLPFYTLPSVADDIDMGIITHVVRGEEIMVTNTAAQIRDLPGAGRWRSEFAHFPLLVGASGEALSKRLGSLSLESLREDGVEPLAVASYLAKIGTSDPVEPRLSLGELAEEFDFAKIGRAPAHFVPED